MSEAKVTAVIVAYESRECIAEGLEALREAKEAGLAECIVVDNASSDNTADFVEREYPWVELIRSRQNIGFGRGCNLGFERVGTEYVLILNPDAVLDLVSLHKLIEFLERTPAAGIAAPATIEGDGKLQAAGLMTTPRTLLRVAAGSSNPYPERRPIQSGEPPFQTSWVCGAVMLIRSELFRKLDGFDPRFFLYFEETDFCRRAAAEGAEIWAVGEAVARHVGGASAESTGEDLTGGCIREHYYRSRFYYLVKHFGWTAAILSESMLVGAERLRAIRRRLRGGRSAGRGSTAMGAFLRMPARPEDVR